MTREINWRSHKCMQVLRWMCGDTKLDRIRNEIIREVTKLGEITKKVQAERMRNWQVLACDESRRALRRKKNDSNVSTSEAEERKASQKMVG